MNKILFIVMISICGLITSCGTDSIELAPNLTESEITWDYTTTGVTNEFVFENTTPNVTTMWDFGNGQVATGSTATAQYAMSGTYTVSVKVLSAGGETTVTRDIVLTEDNTSFLEGEVYDNLAGGRHNTEGKIWVMDRYYKGHMGIGPDIDTPTSWWAAGSNEKDGKGIYDDVFKFTMTTEGLLFEQTTNGYVYANGSAASQLGTTAGNEEPGGGDDFMMPHPASTAIWSITGNDDVITLTGDAFLGYFIGYPASYNITKLTEDELEVVGFDASGNAWFQRFVTEDNMTEAPVAVPPSPVSITSLFDRFDAMSGISWTGDNGTIEVAVEDPTNSNGLVAKHTRGAGSGSHFSAFYTDLDGIIDFTNGVQMMVNVYVPSSNDYSVDTQEDWASVPTDIDGFKTLEIKLHNTLKGGNSWQTQMTVKTDVLKDYEDQWVTLLIDFNDVYAASSDNEDKDSMDRVIFQFGGEGWSYSNDIEIYFDNLIGSESNSVAAPLKVQSETSYPVIKIN